MISYITGIVEEVEIDKVVVDHNGIGYGIYMPQSTLETIGIGEELKIHTYFNVREDAMQLFGFLTKEELKIFKLLIGVSGVGPKGAMAIIGTCPGDSLQMAIISDDAKAISKAPGIGNKTAQRIIIELKDKLDLESMFMAGTENATPVISANAQSETVEALVSLGYSRSMALNAVKKIKNSETMDVEEMLKSALKNII